MPRDLSRPLVTGGAGFIGSALVRSLLSRADVGHVVIIDKLTYAGTLAHLPADDPRLSFVEGDIADGELVRRLLHAHAITGVFNLAAESHVDRSIEHADDFINANITGAFNVLNACREASVSLLQCSTDEVYGSVEAPDRFTEDSPLRPSSPYSASKTAADLLCLAAFTTYAQDVVITRGSNTYGPRQHPEKLIPRMVQCALHDQPMPVYGDGLQVRDWMHVDDHCEGLVAAFLHGTPGGVYNLGACCERTNLELVRELLGVLGKPGSLISHVTDRPGHDRRYAIDPRKARRELDWQARTEFARAFPATILQLADELR